MSHHVSPPSFGEILLWIPNYQEIKDTVFIFILKLHLSTMNYKQVLSTLLGHCRPSREYGTAFFQNPIHVEESQSHLPDSNLFLMVSFLQLKWLMFLEGIFTTTSVKSMSTRVRIGKLIWNVSEVYTWWWQ